MAPHIVGAKVIQFSIRSYRIKSCLGTDDGSMFWSIPDLEHALTGIAEHRSRTHVQLSLDIFKQLLKGVIYHSLKVLLVGIRFFVDI